MQGVVDGKAIGVGLDRTSQIAVDALFDEVLATAAIEGQHLSLHAVRSSVMRRLGLTTSGPVDRHADGLVDLICDATNAFDLPLDEDRLCRWQSAQFPGGTSGIHRLAVGRYRDHEDPMQIVSGRPGRQVMHYEAPPSADVPREMARFLAWFEDSSPLREHTNVDGLARAAIAHLWFETIHPFEDGNGRIGRAIVEMAMAQYLRQSVRYSSLSRQLLSARGEYYDALNQAQAGGSDVTAWVQWFAHQYAQACRTASRVIDQAIEKSRFWEQYKDVDLHARQRKALQCLLDDGDAGFAGGLNAEKYMKMCRVSKATATRDLADMVANGQLWTHGAGKAIRYYINVPGWTHGLVDRQADAKGTGRDAADVLTLKHRDTDDAGTPPGFQQE